MVDLKVQVFVNIYNICICIYIRICIEMKFMHGIYFNTRRVYAYMCFFF